MDKYGVYSKLSKEFALKQLVERFCFEIGINKMVFGEELNLQMLIEDSHSSFLFSKEEYSKAYNESIEILKEIL